MTIQVSIATSFAQQFGSNKMTIRIQGELEIDVNRGVIYFHSQGRSMLRICKLPVPIPNPAKNDNLLDISHKYGTSWDKE